jgi:glycosyltransferase involved in cell wall biosynthesis
MKILIGCSSPPDKGAGILSYTRELAETLLGQGAEVHLASPSPSDWSWVNELSIKHVPTDRDDAPVEAARRVLSYIKDKRVTGVINNDNPVIQSITPGLTCPIVVIGHMSTSSIAALACYRPEWSDYVVAISNDMQKTFVLKYGVPVVKCPIIHSGMRDIGCNGISPRVSDGVLRVIFAGGYNRFKGGTHVLAALLNGSPKWKGMELSWYGGGIPQNVINSVRQLPYVKFYEHVPRETLLNALRNSDVLLFPSRLEGCPMALIEAMSLGVVPIVSDGIGAMRWLISSGLNGYVCNLRRWPDQMFDCLVHLHEHAEVLAKMKTAVRERFLAEHQSDGVTNKILDLLQHPTVNRTHPSERFTVLRWHRPLRPDGLKSPLIDRIVIRLGLLREAGQGKFSE